VGILTGFKKKREYLLLTFLIVVFTLLSTIAFSQESAPTKKRVFKGSATINMGSFEDYFLRIITAEHTLFIKPGTTKKFNIYVRRGDNSDILHNIKITNDDDIFDFKIEPENIEILRNLDMIKLKAELTIPADTMEGYYPIKIKVKADEFVEEAYPIKTKIKVGNKTNFLNISLLLIAFVLFSILIWRKNNLKNLKK
jgi:uncharacterized membrane protein